MTASLPWELLWQTLTSQGFLFYSKCNTAEWAQPYAVSHWCASFQPTLFLGNRCCSALHGASDGPFHKQPTVNEWPLVVLLSWWSAPQWALPTGYLLSMRGPLRMWLSPGWCAGHQEETEIRGRFGPSSGGPGAHADLGQWVSWRAQGIHWGLNVVALHSPH